jgi:hypothetical protein
MEKQIEIKINFQVTELTRVDVTHKTPEGTLLATPTVRLPGNGSILSLAFTCSPVEVDVFLTPEKDVTDRELKKLDKWCPVCMTRMIQNNDNWICPNAERLHR